MDGILLIDKPKGISSFDVIRKLRGILKIKKIGHSGTLDPLATGLLVLGIGKGTKLLADLIGLDKEYEVLARFGYESDTYDADGEVVPVDLNIKIEQVDCEAMILNKFIGQIEQLPPKYSALKIGGKRACDIVRAGGEVDLKPRGVRVDGFEVLQYNWPSVKFRITCSKGTYIRSLIHDLGKDLACGAYVEELRRSKIGSFRVEEAKLLDAESFSLYNACS
ncbi:tRNA pseudouridine(55) synthase TruB [Candidatus Peregrinibacteria bacterium]|nr:tRNA pseudouridine(55) synthase TruB [Candidatus Peregrinibacteria bacterium]